MFEDKKVEIPAYPTAQIIAEKLSATFSFGTDNSRAKDYYDLYYHSETRKYRYERVIQKCSKYIYKTWGYKTVVLLL